MKPHFFKLISRRMWAQAALVMAVFVVVPLLTLGFFLTRTSQRAAQTATLLDHEQLAIRAASEVDEFIKRPRDLLGLTAAILGTIHADRWKQETVLVELALSEEIFGRIALVDLEGKEQAISELGSPLKFRADEVVFKNALKPASALPAIYISEDHLPFITLAAPVRQMGKVTGILMAEVNLRGLWDIVDNIKIGKTGRACVISGDGVLIAHEDKKKVLADQNKAQRSPAFNVPDGRAGSREFSETGQVWLQAYAPIGRTGWTIVVSQSADEAYAFIGLMKKASGLIIALSLAIVILFSVPLARFLVKPIKMLADKMALVAAGNFEQKIESQRQDELGALLEAFNQMAAQLKKARDSERLAAIGKAATAIAHELKNSVVTASTYIGLLPQRHADKEFLEKFITVLPSELNQWKEMLQGISDYSKKNDFELVSTDLSVTLADFSVWIGQRVAQSRLALETDWQGPLPSVKANAPKLRQVLTNLVINAIDAMPKGGVVRLSAKESAGRLVIEVQDTGKGMDKEQIQKIFDPFFTTKSGGLGLGLSISREIVEKHGGRLEVKSQPGQGTCFTVSLPILKNESVLK